MNMSEWVRSHAGTPAFLWLGVVGLRLTSWRLYDAYASPERQLELAKRIGETLPTDFVHPLDHGWLFSEVLGVDYVERPQDFPMSASEKGVARGEARCLRVPDPECEPRMIADLTALRLLREWSPKPLYVSLEGPFTLANGLGGMGATMRSLVKDPGLVDELMLLSTAVVKRYAEAVAATGVDLIIISEPQAANISAEEFERFVLPGCRHILDGIDCWKGMHICGRVDHLVEQMLACGAECLSLEKEMGFPGLAKSLPEGTVLLGNLEPMDFLCRTPSEIRAATQRLLTEMRHHPDFVIAPGCDLPPDTPIDNVLAFLETVREWNRQFTRKDGSG
jgi:uroporphyrinogen decarboxylase